MSHPESLRKSRWQVLPTAPHSLQRELDHLHPVLLQVLYNRGLTGPSQVKSFLEGRYLENEDPFTMPDMEPAVARIIQAIDADETIAVYGDFDADGVTATVLLVQALRGLGLGRTQAQPYIPDRIDEGYGLNVDALRSLREKGIDLVITVDCGIRSIEEVEAANEIGLDMIVTDHHTLGQRLPPAVAVINPKRPDSLYPEKRLAGVGTAYKLAQALRLALPDKATFEEADLLDLVALGTVADIVPLLGENRVLVRRGLEVLNDMRRPGIKALAKTSGLKAGYISAESIAFGLGPRLNAAGRLSHAYDAAKLLAANNDRMASEHAGHLNTLNQRRQRLTEQFTRQAESMLEEGAPILFAADSGFLPGVVGLVAGRLAEKYYRPTIVVEQGEQESRGSCRSIPGFDITGALDKVQSLLTRHGGHAQAAGFTIENSNLDRFREEISAVAAETLADQDLEPTLDIDAEIHIGDVDWALHDVFAKLEPTGADNARPLLLSRNVHVYGHRAVGQDGAHLQLWVGDGRTKQQCIAFRQGAWSGLIPDQVDLAYTVSANHWNGETKLQLVVEEIREAEGVSS